MVALYWTFGLHFCLALADVLQVCVQHIAGLAYFNAKMRRDKKEELAKLYQP